MSEHPSKDIVGTDGDELKGKKIVLCISGSVAAYKAVDLSRLLMRHGADVYAVMSRSAEKLITAELMRWATGNDVVNELTWKLEHIQLANYGMSDLIIYYPCTGNTLSKIANGIDDTAVTSIATVALGSKIPIMIAPAMHEAMYDNPILKENIEKLKGLVDFIEPNITEGKAKVAAPEAVLDAVLRKFSNNNSKLKAKNILVTAGATIEYIDPIRAVTNPASGKLGAAIAEEALRLGANVTVIYGQGSAVMPNVKVIRVKTSDEMMDAVVNELKSNNYDVAVMTAAVSDFKPARYVTEKIDTRANEQITISLQTTGKIVDQIKRVSPNTFLIAFKADVNVTNEQLVQIAYTKMKECHADMIVANDVGREGSRMGSDTLEVFMISKDKRIIHLPLQNKRDVARRLFEEVLMYF